MQFSKILAVVVLPVSMVLAVPVDQESTGLEARGCKWKNCDECHERDEYCVFCDNGGGIFQSLTPRKLMQGPPRAGGSVPAGPPTI
ncbi:uncharacterized protein BDW47DRAFT_127425 [Aspergillus candidus]|uniref:RanBP2-type domain-containing protein n=1 Tax=Aspergillus candidus TaxID=41067 RepID=A0A2I2F6K3_ASPCN|nr:hypothetical protein BDW47DRAFT_127425 [Aspergillus candidus]PLB36267.1 hypothetical protein BDW47DRAFT_127425 [Aspergillus candidus]